MRDGVLALGAVACSTWFLHSELRKLDNGLSLDKVNELIGVINELIDTVNTGNIVSINSSLRECISGIREISTSIGSSNQIDEAIQPLKSTLDVLQQKLEDITRNGALEESLTNAEESIQLELSEVKAEISQLKELIEGAPIKPPIEPGSSGSSLVHVIQQNDKQYTFLEIKDAEGKFLNAKVYEAGMGNSGNVWFAAEDSSKRYNLESKTADNVSGLIGPVKVYANVPLTNIWNASNGNLTVDMDSNTTVMFDRAFGGIRLTCPLIGGSGKSIIANGGNIVIADIHNGADFIGVPVSRLKKI